MYGVSKEKCKKWLLREHPDTFPTCYPTEASNEKVETKPGEASGEVPAEAMGNLTVNEGEEVEKKHQSRGGKAQKKDVATAAEKEAAKRAKAKIIISLTERNRRKAITYIKGMEAFGLELKKVAKRLAGKYACGCSVVKMPAGHEEIALQGEFMDDLVEFIPAEYPEVNRNQIEVNIK